MSSVASIGTSSQSQYIQQLLQGRQSCEAQETPEFEAQEQAHGGSTSSASSATNNHRAQFQANFQSAAQALGIDPSKFKDIQNQIRSAVSDAKSSSGASLTKSQIDQVVNNVLTKNGVDPAQFKSQMQALHQKMGGHRHHHKVGTDTNSTNGSSPSNGSTTISDLGSAVDASSTSGIDSLVNTLPAGSLVDANA